WENAQVGYRLYLDWRNAIDIFGKKVDTMVLHQVGQPDSPSYHDDAPWGLDILKAGKSMGLGGFGRYWNESVAHFEKVGSTGVKIVNGHDTSTEHIAYGDWITGSDTIDLQARLSIYPQDRFTLVELEPSSPVSGLSTGIVKFSDLPFHRKASNEGNWGYIATYGNQTLAGDDDLLGMALFYKKGEVAEIRGGSDDHLVVFKPTDQLSYYFLAAWQQGHTVRRGIHGRSGQQIGNTGKQREALILYRGNPIPLLFPPEPIQDLHGFHVLFGGTGIGSLSKKIGHAVAPIIGCWTYSRASNRKISEPEFVFKVTISP